MYPNPVAAIKGSPFVFRLTGGSSRSIPHFPNQTSNPSCLIGSGSFRRCSSSHDCQSDSGLGSGSVSKDCKIAFRRLGLNIFRAPAALDGGSDGTGGFGVSGGGGGGDKDGGDSGGGGDSSILTWYLTRLEEYPVWTKAITSAFLNLIGDLMCQLVLDKGKYPDLKRIFLFTLLGLILVGPTLHFWYLSLSKLITIPGTLGAFLRILLDQFLFSPIFIGIFMATLFTLEGRPLEVIPMLKQGWFSSVLLNWQLWIPFQFLNFRFVPLQFQVLASNFIALIWNVILSFMVHQEVLSK